MDNLTNLESKNEIVSYSTTSCNLEYIELEPMYLNIRKETLNHLGIGDPLNPTNYSLITPYISGYCNDVSDPFIRVFKELVKIPTTIKNPCNDTSISVDLELEKIVVVASSTYAPILYGEGNIGILSGDRKFVGIDQVIAYIKPGTIYKDPSDFDISFKLQNGTPPTGNRGYTFITFAPDNLDNPNGPGAYFFKIIPSAKIKVKN